MRQPGDGVRITEIIVQIAVIADDLTGANDTAVQFAKSGLRSCVILNTANWSDHSSVADVVIVDTETRALDSTESYRRTRLAAQFLRQNGITSIYKKMDSTLRGNPGPEIHAIEEIMEPDITVIAPAFPRNNRFTVDGCQLLDNVPVSETEFAQDPEAPVRESHLPTLLASQSAASVGHVPLHTVIRGISAVQESIRAQLGQGKRWLVFDAKTDSDLRCIAEAVGQHTRILWAGSAGLAEMLPAMFPHRTAVKINRPSPSKGPVLLIAGSISKSTRDQISELLQESSAFLINLDATEAIRDQNAAASHCINIGRPYLNEESTIVIASAYESRSRSDALAEAAKQMLSRLDLSIRIARTLGMIAAGLASPRLGRFVLTGGLTAFEVCRGLGIECLQLVEEVAPGMPLARFSNELLGEGWMVTKAGAFGARDALIKAVRAVRGDN